MRTFRLLAIALLVLTSLGFLRSTAANPPTAPVIESAFYCDRAALTPAERTRHFDVLAPALVLKRKAVRELPDGYEIQFPSDKQTFAELAEFVEVERRCCPFLDMSLRVAPEHGPIWLRVTGRSGTKQFIQSDAPDFIRPVG